VQREVLLQEITYPGVRVRFGWDTRWNGNGPSDMIDDHEQYQSWSIYALQGITLEQQVTGTVYTAVQNWQLTYGSVTTGDSKPRAARVLQRLQSVVLSGTQPITMPAYIFGYGLYTNKNGDCNYGCDSPESWERQTYNYPRLTRIDNGYGAVMTADYATPDSGGYHVWNYRLAWRETNDGLGDVKRETYTYSYDRCYYDHSGATDIAGCDGIDYYNIWHRATHSGGPLAGYHEVTQTITQTVAGVGTNLPMQQAYTYFTLWEDIPESDRANAPWSQIGRPITETIRSTDGTLYQQIRSTWGHTVTFHMENWVGNCPNNLCHLYYRAGEVWLQAQETTQNGRTTQTSYGYDRYGNITRTLESGFVGVTGDERLTERGYAPNTDANTWIVNKPAWESVYDGSAADPAKLMARTRYTYDGASSYTTAPTKGLLTRIEHGNDTLSITQGTGYDAWGNAVVMTDARGFTSTASYDGWNHSLPLTTTNALGQATGYAYYGVNASGTDGTGPVGMLKAVRDANGVATRYAYDPFGRLVSIVKPGDTFDLPTTQYLYGDTTFTQTIYEAESTAYTHSCGTASGGTWVSAYTPYNSPVSPCFLSTGPSQVPVRASSGQTARFRLAIQQNENYKRAVATIDVYDATAVHLLVSRTLYDTDFLGGFDHPADFDLVFDTTGLAGHALQYRVKWEGRNQLAHDKTTILWALDQPLKVETQQREVNGCESCVQVSQVYYNGLGQAIQQRSESASSSQQVAVDTIYDGLGRVAQTYVPTFTTSSTSFARLSGWDSRPKMQTQYDALGRSVAVTNADGTVTQMGYLGTTITVTDANGHRKDNVADAYGRLQAVVEYSGTTAYTTTYAYDILGNLRVVTDALNNTTAITYDVLGRKVGMRDPDMGTWTYAYDANGNLTTQTDAKGQTVWFGYDKLNRLVEKRQGSSSGTVLAQYEYDQGTNGIGHRSAMTNTSAMMRWSYDVRGRVGIETKAITGITGTFSSFWQYDALDRVTQTRLPSGEVVTTTYDTAGHAATLNAGSQTLVASATYNALGSPQMIASGNGVQTRYLYYGVNYHPESLQSYGRVRQICVTTSNCDLSAYTGTLMNLAYAYDSVGNIVTLRDDTNRQRESFVYDPLDRLVSATPYAIEGVTTTLNYTQTYSYNAIGNFITKAGVTQVYSATQPHAVRSLSNGASFQYDANGNMTQRTEMSGTQLVTYQQKWDIDNRLVVVTNTTASQVTQYFYDADGSRVKRVSPQGTTFYVNADYEVTGPSQMVTPTFSHKLYFPVMACASSDGSGIPSLGIPPLNLATARVIYRFNGQQVAVREGVTLTFIYGDHLGSASVTTNLSGTKVSEVRYYPFGETRYTSGNTATTKRFTSQEEQVGIGLYDYGARFFDPAIGRFVSADSIVPRPGNPQSLNRYSYTNNRPLNLVDPSGHCGKTPTGQQICDSSSSTASVALVVAPTELTVEAAKDTCRPPQEQKRPPAEIRPIPKDVTTMLVTNDPGAALTLVGPIMAPLAAHAGMGMVGLGTTAMEAANAACADGDCTNEARNIKNMVSQIDTNKLKLSNTVAEHRYDLTRTGDIARRYMDPYKWPMLVKRIISAGEARLDPEGLPTGLRWDVEGTYNKSKGIWELVIDTKTNTVLHFLFKSKD
jgi:RHS repeat-associated protein